MDRSGAGTTVPAGASTLIDEGRPVEIAQVPDDDDEAKAAPTFPDVVAVHDLDWDAIRTAVDTAGLRARMRRAAERMETLLDRAGGPGLLFDDDRAGPEDRAIRVSPQEGKGPLWIIGDLHGDLLALEAALAQIDVVSVPGEPPPRIIFLGDLVDDEGHALELLVRVFELIVDAPERICILAGNHDEALTYDGNRFASSVSPADFSEFLNRNLAHEWIERIGKLAIRLTAHAPRALFFASGLLVSHGGFPLKDLHARLLETGDWNDETCLADFVWVRAHPKARRKMPNRFSRGSQFGFDDFADFCAVSAELGRPVTHMVRGHDHVEDRYAIFPAYRAHPVLTTVALSRRLPRESYGPRARWPTMVRVDTDGLPQVVQLQIPAELVESVFPTDEAENGPAAVPDAPT